MSGRKRKVCSGSGSLLFRMNAFSIASAALVFFGTSLVCLFGVFVAADPALKSGR